MWKSFCKPTGIRWSIPKGQDNSHLHSLVKNSAGSSSIPWNIPKGQDTSHLCPLFISLKYIWFMLWSDLVPLFLIWLITSVCLSLDHNLFLSILNIQQWQHSHPCQPFISVNYHRWRGDDEQTTICSQSDTMKFATLSSHIKNIHQRFCTQDEWRWRQRVSLANSSFWLDKTMRLAIQ